MKPFALLLVLLAAAGCGDDDGAGRPDAAVRPDAAPDSGPPLREDPCLNQVAGTACTWLGIPGQEGFTADGSDRFNTRIYWVMNMLFASDGFVYFDDWNNHLIRRIDPDDQTVHTMVGWTDPIFPGDGVPGMPMAERTGDGALGTDVQLNHPTDLAETADGHILIMAWHNHKLRQLDPATGLVKILAGKGAGYAPDIADDPIDEGAVADALFKQPKALARDPDGNLYIADQQNQRVRMITAEGTGTIKTIAGSGAQGYGGDGADAVAPASKINWEVGSNPEPSGGLAWKDGKLYVADTLNNRIRVVDLTLETPTIDTVAGTDEAGDTGDGGPAIDATLNHPRDLEIGPDGDLYIADTDNNVIRAIDLDTGDIRRVAGTGEIGLGDENLPALETALRRPFGIEFDADGNLYIMDSLNSRVLKVLR
jgi:DNA-binding beta-propeller fold protein YncE